MNQKQWKGKTRGGNFGQKFLFISLRYIPVIFFYPIIYFAVFFFIIFEYNHFKIITKYFKIHFNKSTFKAKLYAYRNYVSFGKIVLDKFAMINGNVKQFSFKIFGQEHFDRLLNKEEGFIITSAHIGNFELSAFALQQDKKQINGLIFGEEAKIYNNVRINAFDKINLNTISVKEDLSHLFEIKESLSKGNIFTIMCDRIYGSEKRIELDFLNGKANFPQGPFRLAIQMNVNILSIFVVKKKFRKYFVYCKPVNKIKNEINRIKQTEFIAKGFVSNLEDVLIKHNEQWFNYYDFWGSN